jgi:subtilase family serine protease
MRNCQVIEILESRVLLSDSPSGLSPDQIRHAYGFDHAIFDVQGQQVAADGAGQTIAVVSVYNTPRLRPSFRVFSETFGLPITDDAGQPLVSKQMPQGRPRVDEGWGMESLLDVEWAHAIAPKAKIVLVQAISPRISDLLKAVDYARSLPGVSVVSMSWGADEFSQEQQDDSTFTTPEGHTGVTFVAASGDSGVPAGWPAVSANVLAVGGTTLHLDSGGNYAGETVWDGSGGGRSMFTNRPTPDVAYNADPQTGVSIYTANSVNGQTGWFTVGGTSAGAPQWAGLIALVDQGRTLEGKGTLDGATQTLPAIYSVSSDDFHDITVGSNGRRARPGFDLATGRGSPVADRLITDLVAA